MRRRSWPLFHFTCAEHGAPFIRSNDGMVAPRRHVMLDVNLAWFTSQSSPKRDDCGLTSTLLSCDRMATRWRVTDRSDCVRWVEFRSGLAPDLAEVVGEMESFGRPETWWVSQSPVPVERAS